MKICQYKAFSYACSFFKYKVVRSYNGTDVFVDKVCDYFGVKIAMYFAYLGHYTAALLWPAFLGTMLWMLSGTHQVNVYSCIEVSFCFIVGSRALSFSDPYFHFACLSVRHSVIRSVIRSVCPQLRS